MQDDRLTPMFLTGLASGLSASTFATGHPVLGSIFAAVAIPPAIWAYCEHRAMHGYGSGNPDDPVFGPDIPPPK